MALRAFHNNPSIGGFGNESSSSSISRNRKSFLVQESVKDGGSHRLQKKKNTTTCSRKSTNKNGIQKKDARKAAVAAIRSPKSEMSMNHSTSSPSYESSGDAFAQIIKELVDNAVDACRGNTSVTNSEELTNLKRVRVLIEKVPFKEDFNTKSNVVESHANHWKKEDERGKLNCYEKIHPKSLEDDDEESSSVSSSNTTTETNDENEVLRVTVTDNGCGMENIEHCVSVFSTTKSGQIASTTASTRMTRKSSTTPSNEATTMNATTVESSSSSLQEHPTAGRYGLGLTLCLLHAQRLVPNSCASITSSTSKQNVWTVAKFVVDAERDTVVCVDKQWKEKKNHKNGDSTSAAGASSSESGTAVSLLVPGGKEAKNAWPRLAEYFARFQLSLGLKCSLEIKAPSLSSHPLYIRPIYEKKKDEVIEKEEQQNRKYVSRPTTTTMLESMNDTMSMVRGEEQEDQAEVPPSIIFGGNGNSSNDSFKEVDDNEKTPIDSNHYMDLDHDEITDWIASSQEQIQAPEKDFSNISPTNKIYSSEKYNNVDDDDDDNEGWVDYLNENQEYGIKNNLEKSKVVVEKDATRKSRLSHQQQASKEKCRQSFMVSAVSKYLQKSIPMKNFAHCIQPIRVDTQTPSTQRSKNESYPTLEVDMIVCGDTDSTSSDNFDGYEENDSEERNHTDSGSAKIFVIRMVNHIPLLDGSEAFACGIVKGVSEKQNLWNSFGLDVSPSNHCVLKRSQCRYSSSKSVDVPSNSSLLHIPTFSVKDNAQVAQYFANRNHTHSLFEYCSDEDESSCDSSHERRRGKRKKKRDQLLLPAEIRLGNILLVVQLHAKPAHLPMPTLSKGRLPMNNKCIDEALDLCISSCLKSLQKSNPSLLLTASQLKKSERNSRFLPSVSEAISSIMLNCNDREIQQHMLDIVNGWRDDSKESVSIVTPEVNNSPNSFESKNPDYHKSEKEIKFNSSDQSLSQQELSETIESQFRRMIRVVEESKIEQSMKARANHAHKKKKALSRDDKLDSGSCCSSTEDLDAFVTTEGSSSQILSVATEDDCQHHDINSEKITNEDLDTFIVSGDGSSQSLSILAENDESSSDNQQKSHAAAAQASKIDLDDFKNDDDWWSD